MANQNKKWDALRAAAVACEGWSWPDRMRDENGTHHFGQRRDGEFYEIGTIDAWTYTSDYADDIRVLKFIRAAQPDAVLSLFSEIDRLRAALQAQQGRDQQDSLLQQAIKVRESVEAQQGEAKDARQADGNSVSKDTTMAIWQHLATSTVLDTGTAMRCAKEIVKLLRQASTPTIDQEAKDAPAPATLSDDQAWDVLAKELGVDVISWDGKRAITIETPVEAGEVARALLAAAGSSQGQDGKDAARYRWLRDKENNLDAVMDGDHMLFGDSLDCSIDAALAAKEAGK